MTQQIYYIFQLTRSEDVSTSLFLNIHLTFGFLWSSFLKSTLQDMSCPFVTTCSLTSFVTVSIFSSLPFNSNSVLVFTFSATHVYTATSSIFASLIMILCFLPCFFTSTFSDFSWTGLPSLKKYCQENSIYRYI